MCTWILRELFSSKLQFITSFQLERWCHLWRVRKQFHEISSQRDPTKGTSKALADNILICA